MLRYYIIASNILLTGPTAISELVTLELISVPNQLGSFKLNASDSEGNSISAKTSPV